MRSAAVPIVRIEHSVPEYEGRKHVFDADPADRKASGARSYQSFRSVGPGKDVMRNPRAASVVEAVESIGL
jgi:hypothetical protein